MRPDANYFIELNALLRKRERAIPALIIDLDLLDANIDWLKNRLDESGKQLRLVAKSLPSPQLIDYAATRLGTSRLMVFHQPFLSDLSRRGNAQTDLLLGKPMPVKTARYYYEQIAQQQQESLNSFDPFKQVQWLVDTVDRVRQYISLSKSLRTLYAEPGKLRLSLEIDVGLHRGGFASQKDFKAALELISKAQEDGLIELAGLMGYEPHIVKLPSWLRPVSKALKMSNNSYADFIALIKSDFPKLWSDRLVFNGAGSTTLDLHTTANSLSLEIAAGSCLVKPLGFDVPTLAACVAAAFIATPILKKSPRTTLPGLEQLKWLQTLLGGASSQHAYFIYGGAWKAEFCHPSGLKENKLFGSSTNQNLVNGPGQFGS